jgi:hypothetical protein
MFLARAGTAAEWKAAPVAKRRAQLEAVLARPQVPQRTPAWYAQGKEVLTASEFGKLYDSQRTRDGLVLSKVPELAAAAPTSFTNRLACLTCEMGPFDWGIRFEPVVKQVLERRWGAKILEAGRILHPTDTHLAASPDGLIVEATAEEHVGRLLEIKCPIRRAVGEGIPFEYWCQMQIQMEVTGLEECDYVEVKLQSVEKHAAELPEGVEPEGWVWLLQNPVNCEMAYAYTEAEREERLANGWELTEVIPWRVEALVHEVVPRDRTWFAGTAGLREAFWADVATARRGAFQQAPSTARAARTTKVVVQKEGAAPPTTCLLLDD